MIEFNIPPVVGTELENVKKAIENHKICGDGEFTFKCSKWMEEKFHTTKALLTTSCTSALEMTALLAKIEPGDEVIMPSYTFVSTANAFVLRGARIVFVDIRPDTMNIDETLIEDAITEKTRAIVPVHYAGVSCEMDTILEIAKRHNLLVIEDAAQGVMSMYKDQYLGTIGDMGCYSFHETKNYSMGEGGAIILKDRDYIEQAEIIREKGTDRSKFYRGQVDKYSWVSSGSSFLPSDINAAYLWTQLLVADEINDNRLATWNYYHEQLKELEEEGCITRPVVPEECKHNAHMYYIKAKDLAERTALIQYLKENDVQTVFHYIPLHSSTAGQKYGRFHGEDRYTTTESERLIRLPMYYNVTEEEREKVVEKVKEFYHRDTLVKKKKIAIIGANSFQNPLILKAKEMGYETHVFAWKCGDVGEYTADVFHPISTLEKEEILKQCQALGIDAITTIASDLATTTVNYVANKMNLPSNSLDSTLKATNKFEMRKAFAEHHVPTPGFVEMTQGDSLSKLDTLSYPLIIKPTDRSGSRAVTKVSSVDEVEEALARAMENSFEKKAIVEEFIEGNEFSIEGITYQGKHTFLTITRKATTGAPHFIETGHIEPAGISKEQEEKIHQVITNALDALEVTNSATHSEFKITPDGQIRIIEIGARMGGDCIGSHLVEISTGYDYLKMVLDVAMGQAPSFEKVREPKIAIIRFIFGKKNLEELERVRNEVPEALCFVSDLEEVTDHEVVDSSTRFGYYILACDNKDKIRWLLNEQEQY